jgi:peptidoglycan/LPS O-acetylase OafA/YrhL
VLSCALLGIGAVFRNDLPWFLSYLPNWRFAYTGVWGDLPSAPTWSLGVEEQFYLVWPTLVLFAPRRRLRAIFLATVAIGVISRALVALVVPYDLIRLVATVPTTSNLDTLGMGALLALYASEPHESESPWINRSLYLGLALFTVTIVASILQRARLIAMVEAIPVALVSVWLVHGAARGFDENKPIGWFLSRRAVRYVGTISYGVYLLHEPVAWVIRYIVKLPLWGAGLELGMLRTCVVLAASIAAASMSWHGMERPINQLKARFRYDQGNWRSGPAPELESSAAVS